ncbi:large ribosomal subunit protein mL52 [Topomyia yanbarensis]|uniref:large ribosomal subunit protein mL52 n=1 Tax=Topomyia yanbarensis TaxID=2498891 RepID=UPI00273A98E1|nr:large ribosomal subunit protein mL52 [Topomyia yanbarensis]
MLSGGMQLLTVNVSKRLYQPAGYILRRLSVSICLRDDQIKRQDLFLRNFNKSGPLTDLPDYSYIDGKIVPLGANQKKRILQQRELATKIVTLSKEMDFALERYNRLQKKQQFEKQAIIDNKLKPKGHLLLK